MSTMQSGFLRDTDGSLLVSQAASATSALTDTQLRASVVPVTAKSTPLTSSAVARVTGSATVATLQASNANRRSLAIYNDSTALLRIKLGSAASATDFTVLLGAASASTPGGYYELPLPIHTGIVTGIWESATGAAQVTEGV